MQPFGTLHRLTSMEKWIYLLIGVAIGWITKIPFLIKWYKEYQAHKIRVEEYFKKLDKEKP